MGTKVLIILISMIIAKIALGDAEDRTTPRCTLSSKSVINNPSDECIAVVECTAAAVDITSQLSRWPYCGESRTEQSYYRLKIHNKYVFIHEFYLHLKIRNVQTIGNPFAGIENYNRRIRNVTITESETIPTDINTLHLSNVVIFNNTIERIDLKFLAMTGTNNINASNNYISEIETNLENTKELDKLRKLTTIDLSYNYIEVIPNNCFAYFSNLQHLNLSHNLINNLDILTFEGLAELRTLQLSHNKLLEIGQSLARFTNLQELSIDNNFVTSLTEANFRTTRQLKKLNLSYNKLEVIEDESLQNLNRLRELDLSYNKISVIRKTLFRNSSDLQSLCLSNNNITTIESGAFEGKNITQFNIENNTLTGPLASGAFEGMYVNSMDLTNGLITELESGGFRTSHIASLNLSSNVISNISKSAFQSLNDLLILDLSNNHLSSIDFDTTDLTDLSLFSAQNNSIKRIPRNTFQNLSTLFKLDLSYNAISEVESQSFKDLENLETLNLSHNYFLNSIEAHTFIGLSALIKIELDHTRTQSIRDEAFSGLKSLRHFNASHGELKEIRFDAFKNTGSLEIIDISFNLLEHFLVNTSSISIVKELYLNKNKLTNVSSEMLSGLVKLQKLDLANNNIIKVDPKSLIIPLSNLDLSSNDNLEISGNAFENVPLTVVSLNHINVRFNFEHASNTSIQQLELSSCGVKNLNSLFIFKVKNIVNLYMSKNKITFIDKNTFQDMPSLMYLDLSFNLISSIQPGSFLHTNSIRTLNLHENEISSLQFGVLDGLHDLYSINLSNNAVHSFGVNLLHNIPHISIISLDNNVIEDIEFEDFINKKLKKITIGGNPISCHVFTELKSKQLIEFSVTAEMLDYHTENVDGVTCRSDYNKYKSINWSLLNGTDANTTNAFIELGSAINNLRESVEKLSIKNELNHTDILKTILTDILMSIDKHMINNTNTLFRLVNEQLINSSKSHIDNTDNLKQLTDVIKQLASVSKETKSHIVRIDEHINNQTNNDMINNKYFNVHQTLLTDDDLQEKIKVLNEVKDKMIIEVKMMFQDLKNESLDKKYNEAHTDSNGNALMYINVICLLIITVVFLSLAYSFYKSRNRLLYGHNNDIHSSTQPIANAMEMQ